jgi:hypothetical protein
MMQPPEGDEGDKKKERKIDTPEGQNEYWNQLKQSEEWKRESGFSKPTLRNTKTGDLIQKSKEKWEIEVFGKDRKHKGIIRPSEGVIKIEFAKAGRTIK